MKAVFIKNLRMSNAQSAFMNKHSYRLSYFLGFKLILTNNELTKACLLFDNILLKENK